MSVMLGVGRSKTGEVELGLLASRGWNVAIVPDELGGLVATARKGQLAVEVSGSDSIAALALPLTLVALRAERGEL